MMNDPGSRSDHDILIRLDESINGKDGLKDVVQRLEIKLDDHFGNHRRERNAIIAALASAIAAVAIALISILTGK